MLSKAGGRDEATPLPQMKSSKWYMKKVRDQVLHSTPVTSQVIKTQQTTHPTESMAPENSSYHPSLSHIHTDNWLSTLTKNLAQSSLIKSVTEQLQNHSQNMDGNHIIEQGQNTTMIFNIKPKKYLHKRKAGYDPIHHPATLPPFPPHNTRPAPYSDHLRPLPSAFQLHVLARDQIQLWKPIAIRNNHDPKGNPTMETDSH